MEIQNFITGAIFNETISKLKTKAKDETKRTFSELFDKGKEQSASVTSNLPENFSTDNAVKSTLFLGSLETQREHNASSMTTIKLSESEKNSWNNGKLPEGLRMTNAGGVIFSGGTRKYSSELGIYYTDGAEYDYQN